MAKRERRGDLEILQFLHSCGIDTERITMSRARELYEELRGGNVTITFGLGASGSNPVFDNPCSLDYVGNKYKLVLVAGPENEQAYIDLEALVRDLAPYFGFFFAGWSGSGLPSKRDYDDCVWQVIDNLRRSVDRGKRSQGEEEELYGHSEESDLMRISLDIPSGLYEAIKDLPDEEVAILIENALAKSTKDTA